LIIAEKWGWGVVLQNSIVVLAQRKAIGVVRLPLYIILPQGER